jgi:hypothetical protein
MAARQLSDGNDDGTVIGQSATDKVGFHGVTPVVQQTTIADATDATTAISQLNEVIAVLEAYGLTASS